ncbi:MAG: response regulator [Methylococcales bacterium]|jgi:CheY-like chemotaxis protein|nr:response regulator [Methylococcales bacterium]MBT7445719.1 response regulator [Methylococcales bacterium]
MVTLPLSQPDVMNVPHAPIEPDRSGLRQMTDNKKTDGQFLRVLVVEDNIHNQKVASFMLKKFDCHVVFANNGQECLDKVCEADFDIVFMDVQMPILNGYEATSAIRALSDNIKATVPIIAMTANALVGDEALCLDAGMNGYLSKPIIAAELERVIVQWGVEKNC